MNQKVGTSNIGLAENIKYGKIFGRRIEVFFGVNVNRGHHHKSALFVDIL